MTARKLFCTNSKNIYLCSPLWEGELAEWLMSAVLKTVDPKGFGGSNPSLSAKRRQLVAKATSCFWFRPVAKASFRRGPGPKTVAGGPSGRQLPSTLHGPPRRAEWECEGRAAPEHNPPRRAVRDVAAVRRTNPEGPPAALPVQGLLFCHTPCTSRKFNVLIISN